MSKSSIPADVIGQLREVQAWWKGQPENIDIVGSKKSVLARYQPVFSPENVKKISEDEFYSFLLFKNNCHWDGLHRYGSRMTKDMKKLRASLSLLLDESLAVDERLDKVIHMIHGMGKGVVTAVMQVAYPDKYGVWNNTSEAGMKIAKIWPAFERGESFGSRYLKVNNILHQLCEDLDLDLWSLDSLWWGILQRDEQGETQNCELPTTVIGTASSEDQIRFGLESHLHEFLRDNWDKIELGKEWEIYKEPGDDEAGYEYQCDVGRIDLLAKHRAKPRWLVIELKRNQSSDQTVGQVLRYMGWVQANLAEKNETVEGLVIAHKADQGIRYALSLMPNIKLKLYEVEFYLRDPSKTDEE